MANTEIDLNVERVIGKYSTGEKGNLLLVTAGVHGNEPSGVIALKKIFEHLEKDKHPVKGTLLGLAGNVNALNHNKRFIDSDMNRVWPDQEYEKPENPDHEQREMMEIVQLLKQYPASDFDERYFIDCHSTSSDSVPYISVQDVGKNDSWAHEFPLYIVRGFSDLINGSIDNYFSKNQFTGFTHEGGQHFAEDTVDHQEAVIWLGLERAGILKLEELETYPSCVEVIRENQKQKTFEILYRHELKEGDDFEMKPGYKNFERIEKGEVLAVHNGREVRSDWDAHIFMPLYQKQGSDGFFVVEEVS